MPGYIGEFNVFNGGTPNFWGWYDVANWVQRPVLATDSADEIERKWRLWNTTSIFARNDALGIRQLPRA